MPTFPQTWSLSKSFTFQDLQDIVLCSTKLRIKAAGDCCAQTMRAIANSTNANRVISFQSCVEITAEDTTSTPYWDDFKLFVTQCQSCETLEVEGYGFNPVAHTLAMSQLHAVFMLLIAHGRSLRQVVIELPAIEDHDSAININEFAKQMNAEFARAAAPVRWAHFWYEYRISRKGVPMIRFAMEIRRNNAVLQRMLKTPLHFAPLHSHDTAGNGSCTPVTIANGSDCGLLVLTKPTHLKFDSSLFKNDDVHYQYNRFIANIITADWTPCVSTLSLHVGTHATLAFGDSPRAGKRFHATTIWWKEIADVLAACPRCRSLTMTGGFHTSLGVSSIINNLQDLVDPLTDVAYLGSIIVEMGKMHSSDAENVSAETQRFRTASGVIWEQGFSQSAGGSWLIWVCKLQQIGERALKKRATGSTGASLEKRFRSMGV